MTVKRMTSVALFTALIVVFTVIIPPIPVPILNINVTLQTFVVMLAGLVLRPTDAFISMLLYLLIGAMGLPIFSGYQGGVGVLAGYQGGFLFAFPFAALFISMFNQGKKSFPKSMVIAFLFGSLFVNLAGSLTVAFNPASPLYHTASYRDILFSLAIFLPGDFIKAVVSAIMGQKLRNVTLDY